MTRILGKIFITSLTLLFVAKLVPGIHLESFYTALFAAILLGVMNLIARPILILITLPVTILTLGLFIFIINAVIFGFVADVIPGFAVDSMLDALIGSIIVSIVSTTANKLL